MTPLRQRMLEELRRRNYSTDTIRGYLHAVEQFATHFHKSPEMLGIDEIGRFQLHLLEDRKLALGTIALRMGALRFLYKKVLRRRDLDFENLPLLRTPKKLPVVLSPEEVARLIEAAPNLLYRTLLMLLYATGLRRTEAANLKVSDIDSSLMLIHVHQGKGARDREAVQNRRLRLVQIRQPQHCFRKAPFPLSRLLLCHPPRRSAAGAFAVLGAIAAFQWGTRWLTKKWKKLEKEV